MKAYLVEVSCLVDFDDLDAEDVNEDGECAVDGTYALRLTGNLPEDPVERVLDIFHDHIGIACLDDFTIIARPANDQDLASWEGLVRHDLGDFPGQDSAEPEDDPEI